MVGDLEANAEHLRGKLRKMRFPMQTLDWDGLRSGQPTTFLPILHYVMLEFSAAFASFLSDSGYELRSKSDLRFVEALFKLLRDLLSYSPVLSVRNFFSPGFAERKILFCLDVLHAVTLKADDLTARNSIGSSRTCRGASLDRAAHLSEFDGTSLPTNDAWIDELALPQVPPEPCPLVDADAGSSSEEQEQNSDLPAESSSEEQASRTSRNSSRTSRTCRTIRTSGQERTQQGQHSAPVNERAAVMVSMGGQCQALVEGNDPLSELLEEIRRGLERRFERLEQRVEAHIETATARATLLEGEVKILAAKLSETHELLRRAMASPTSQQFLASSALPSPARETRWPQVQQAALESAIAKHQPDVNTPSLDHFAPTLIRRRTEEHIHLSENWPNVSFCDPFGPSHREPSQSFDPSMSTPEKSSCRQKESKLERLVEEYDVVQNCKQQVQEEILPRVWQDLTPQKPQNLLVGKPSFTSLSDPACVYAGRGCDTELKGGDARALIAKLTAQFKDTQQLLRKAQETTQIETII
eukprot:TRINITY_DN7222_c0_g1_i1.p1 TRINITY_DN7222_c0_g1~~TRINITY_DN7222_c0_g1_i1.p1  ORF type:complete len:541 (-),score=90.95 TRINITY_DN7222_c0_g1_i1:163-1746(-)